ncbi:MAG: NADH-quinone oxidoreductase subunit C [Methanomassiliicoccus sp.]|nr:NADH-quinone oxidoreductase subunit C [Methanomassiliicoccus sp.]
MAEDVSYTVEQVKSKISEAFPTAVKFESKTKPRRLFMTADKGSLLNLAKMMKEQLGFDQCSLVTGVDRCDRMQAVYHLTSYTSNITAEIVVDLPRDNPEVDSIAPLWGGANWHEREAYDMFGIIFKGHPKLERLLLPADYTFFPMRKDCDKGRD